MKPVGSKPAPTRNPFEEQSYPESNNPFEEEAGSANESDDSKVRDRGGRMHGLCRNMMDLSCL